MSLHTDLRSKFEALKAGDISRLISVKATQSLDLLWNWSKRVSDGGLRIQPSRVNWWVTSQQRVRKLSGSNAYDLPETPMQLVQATISSDNFRENTLTRFICTNSIEIRKKYDSQNNKIFVVLIALIPNFNVQIRNKNILKIVISIVLTFQHNSKHFLIFVYKFERKCLILGLPKRWVNHTKHTHLNWDCRLDK